MSELPMRADARVGAAAGEGNAKPLGGGRTRRHLPVN
jgi:hypothetical protein